MGHVITVSAEISDLTTRIIVVESEPIQTTVIVVRQVWCRAQPRAVIESLGHRHRFPTRLGTDLVVEANLGHDLFYLANLPSLNRFANELTDRIRSFVASGLKDAVVFANCFYHLATIGNRKR